MHHLDILLELTLSWVSQIVAMSRSAFNQLRLIAQFRSYLDKGFLRDLVQALVIFLINYCNAIYMGLPLSLIRKFQRVQKMAARLVVDVSKIDFITTVLACPYWLPIASWIRFKVLTLTYCIKPFMIYSRPLLLVRVSFLNVICLTHKITSVKAPLSGYPEGGPNSCKGP